ncbi:putative MarR-family transcriptional regulator [Frankia canadensis]|uniref:Putative MarR-family transcriptional regulator n=1 Tax=Frankia canadensis TaxID=1836972 RepID=A0A2I2KIK9_9ACTN|nr:MarR family transcriptional regulator [Frankia canadensis]SNQ45508.1 putative MarR-family transcriptional regulator [Frankia canadensis]SOU52798.1 putative MarR-family transcriptional regulator [Frankia canadensis]
MDPTPDLAAQVGATFERLARLVRHLGQPSDLSLVAVATLSTLDRLGPHRLTALAAREGVTQPAMTQLVGRLADAGLVGRAADPGDGRVVLVHITDEGRRMLAERRARRAERVADLLRALDLAERASLMAALPALDALVELASGAERPATQAGRAERGHPVTPPA